MRFMGYLKMSRVMILIQTLLVGWGVTFLTSHLYGQTQTGSSHLNFTDDSAPPNYSFLRSSIENPYLVQLRTEYKLNEIVAEAKSDYERVRLISRWVRTQWEHNGSNEPQKAEPIAILKEAATGKQFRCVEYSIVLSAALNSVGIPARVLGLMMQDVETRELGAGHVVAEAYLVDLKKWIMVDGQWDVIPVLNNQPLNAVELQRALAANVSGIDVNTFSNVSANGYLQWISPYLFYFDTKLDSRFGLGKHVYNRHSDAVVLVPLGAKEPTVFQRVHPLRNELYTHSLKEFYAQPAIGSKD